MRHERNRLWIEMVHCSLKIFGIQKSYRHVFWGYLKHVWVYACFRCFPLSVWMDHNALRAYWNRSFMKQKFKPFADKGDVLRHLWLFKDWTKVFHMTRRDVAREMEVSPGPGTRNDRSRTRRTCTKLITVVFCWGEQNTGPVAAKPAYQSKRDAQVHL